MQYVGRIVETVRLVLNGLYWPVPDGIPPLSTEPCRSTGREIPRYHPRDKPVEFAALMELLASLPPTDPA